MLNLGFEIEGKPMDKRQGNKATVDLNFSGDQMLKTLSMSYYGNQLGVYFSAEAIVIYAIDILFKEKKTSTLKLNEIVELS